MKIEKQKEELYCKYKIAECSEAEKTTLKKMAIERFAKDEQAQMEYIGLSILKEATDNLLLDKVSQIITNAKSKKIKGE